MSAIQFGVSPPLPVGVYARRPADELPFPLGRDGSALFSRARHALWQGVQALGLGPGDEVLVPAYHHGSEIEALLRAGLTLSFYEAGPKLEPDPDELESLFGPSVRALYLIHYLGFPQNAARWRAWCDERRLLLLEDAGQSWLASDESGPAGSLGDLAIFCIYKSVGVPDGGALVVRAAAPRPERTGSAGILTVSKQHALWAAQRSRALARLAGRTRRDGTYDPAADFTLGDPASAPTVATQYLLPRLAGDQIAAKRRANYALLLEAAAGHVPPPFDELRAAASPLVFPVETDDKDGLIARLAARGIDGLDVWRLPHPSLPAGRFPGARERRARTVGLPVHQELRPEDVDRIAAAVATPHRRRVVRMEPIQSFEEVGERWDELAEASANVFATREWLSLWWEHFGRGKRLLLTACFDDRGRLFAILPLYLVETRGIRVLRLLGHGTADQLGPICAPADTERAGRALRRLLGERVVGWDFFLGELLPGNYAWTGMLGARSIARDGSPILRFSASSWEEYLRTRSRTFRKMLGRIDRRLRDAHAVDVRLTEDPARLPDDLDTLFALHRMRWTDAESPFGANERFHREVAALALGRGWLFLWVLELDGLPVAAEYTFRYAGAQNHYQSGRDPGWDDASVGSFLFSDSVRRSLEAGLTECRFLRGREQYKYRFATDDPELETIGVARGSLGDAALATTLALRRRREVGALRRWLGG